MGSLLAVDLGVKTGLALYRHDGRLAWYRSRNFGTAGRLRHAVPALLDEIVELERIVVEGGGPLAAIWQREADRRGVTVQRIAAEQWRQVLLLARQHRDSDQAKRSADGLARRVIEWSRASRPTSLRHDAAEAILIGLWGVLDAGWLERLPGPLRP